MSRRGKLQSLSVPAAVRPLAQGVLALAVFGYATVLLRHSHTNATMSWWPWAVPWFLIGVTRSQVTQKVIGRGRLDNRVALRLVIDYVLFFLLLAPTGVAFLFPVATALVATTYVQWAGSRAWPIAAWLNALFTAVLQVSLGVGVVPTFMPVHPVHFVTFACFGLGLAVTGNVGMLTRQKEVTARALAHEQEQRTGDLVKAATHDTLTGLLNRAGMEPALEAARASAAPGKGIGVLFMDLDGFKAVNDTEGHGVGDELLCAVAQRLSAVVRSTDALARVGGDEFVAVLAGLPTPLPLHALSERIRAAIEKPFELSGATAKISVSVGLAYVEAPQPSIDALMHEADTAMYEHKRARPDRSTRTADRAVGASA